MKVKNITNDSGQLVMPKRRLIPSASQPIQLVLVASRGMSVFDRYGRHLGYPPLQAAEVSVQQ